MVVPGLCSRWQQLLGSIMEPNHNLQGTTCRRKQPKITQKVSQKSLSCTGVVQKVQSGAGWCPESTLKVVLGLDSFSGMGSFRSPLFEKSFQKFHFLPQKSTFAQIFCSPHNQARLIPHLNIMIRRNTVCRVPKESFIVRILHRACVPDGGGTEREVLLRNYHSLDLRPIHSTIQ